MRVGNISRVSTKKRLQKSQRSGHEFRREQRHSAQRLYNVELHQVLSYFPSRGRGLRFA